jgi:hypothetical protein
LQRRIPVCTWAVANLISSNLAKEKVIIKSVSHWRLQNERDVLHRFQARAPSIRPLVDEIEDSSNPPAIVLKYLDDDVLHASATQRFTTAEIKYIAKIVLQALEVLHEDGFVHTGKQALSKSLGNTSNAHKSQISSLTSWLTIATKANVFLMHA